MWRVHPRASGRLLLVSAVCLLAVPLAARAQTAGGNLSGVVLPDLPPEVSPGEVVAFTPPAGSEGGTWTLSGVVAEEVKPPEPPAAAPKAPPPPVKVGLKLPEGGGPWTDEHLVGLAVAAAVQDGSWAQCADPASAAIQKKAGDGIGGVEVGIRKKPGHGSTQLASQVLVAGPPGPPSDEKGAKRQEAAFEAVREAVGGNAQIRMFGIDVAPSGCAYCKSFFESRSNTAKRPDTAAYSIAAPGLALAEVEITGMTDPGAAAPAPSMVVAVSIARPQDGGANPGPAVVAAAPVQCATATERSHPDYDPRARPPSKPNLLSVKVPDTLKPGNPFPVSFKDRSGRTVLDVREAPGVHVVPPRPVSPAPSLDAAPEFSIAGRPVCACGNFPDVRSRQGFLFDEQAVSALSASSHMAILPLAATVRAGRHPISGSPSAGFSAKDVVYTTVINVNGRLDANSLRRGQSTQMELTIVGTDKPLSLRVVNNTPHVISIAGRIDQVLTTTGGTPNHVVQTVDSVAPGNFGIDYSLAADRCPCQTERR